jgi:uncharacterized protein (TIGR00297 family)
MHPAFYLLPVIIGVLAYINKSLDEKGAILGTAFGIIMVHYMWVGFVLLLVFFVVGDMATKYRYSFKKKLGLEDISSIRCSENVIANGIVPVIFSIALMPASLIASISTALSDTLSSEIGTAFGKKPVLITNFKKVKVGAHGGITREGTIAGLFGTLLIGSIAGLMGLMPLHSAILTSVICGSFGFIFDSILGATIQSKGYVNNSQVNLLATAVGGLLAIPPASFV